METRIVRPVSLAAFVLPLLAACVSMTPGNAARQRIDYGPEAFTRIRDSLIGGEDRNSDREQPRVRIIAPSTFGADHYVDATVRVSRDAYVLVVASDLDGRIRVVFPESPDESGFVSASAPHKLSKFFAGFGALGSARYGRSAFSVEPAGRRTPRGAMVAVASERPLQLERITDGDGNWSESELERLVFGRSPHAIGYALGSHLSLAGQEFDADFSGLTQWGTPSLYSLASVGSALCESDFTGALYYDAPRPTTYFVRDGTRYAVVTSGDSCTGYQTRTIPVGPAIEVPRDSLDSARVRGAAAYAARRESAGPGRFSAEQLDETVARARRSGPVNGDGTQLRPADRPNVAGGLRFRPPEQLRAEPRLRDINGNLRTWPDEERARGRTEGVEQSRQRPTPQSEERPRPELMRSEPAPLREAPMAAPAAPAAPREEASGKPRKE